MHIYAFGSLCRGEIYADSDVDLLVLTDGFDQRLDPQIYSIYSYKRIRELWNEGNPFAWHLHTESKIIFASDKNDFLSKLDSPSQYDRYREDCLKFFELFQTSVKSLTENSASQVFDLATAFLAIRNFASCFSLGVLKKPIFSRHSAKHLGSLSLDISDKTYALLERSRLLSTRGIGVMVLPHEVTACLEEMHHISLWFEKLTLELRKYDRV